MTIIIIVINTSCAMYDADANGDAKNGERAFSIQSPRKNGHNKQRYIHSKSTPKSHHTFSRYNLSIRNDSNKRTTTQQNKQSHWITTILFAFKWLKWLEYKRRQIENDKDTRIDQLRLLDFVTITNQRPHKLGQVQ